MSQNDENTRKNTLESTQLYLEFMREQRWDEWIELWADDALLEFPFAPDGRQSVFKGKMEILEYMSGATARIRVDDITELNLHPMLDPHAVMVELAIKGKILSNDADYLQRYVSLFKFSNGKIHYYREYWNPLVSIKAFGGYDAWMRQSGGA